MSLYPFSNYGTHPFLLKILGVFFITTKILRILAAVPILALHLYSIRDLYMYILGLMHSDYRTVSPY
jgi:hypothetical protein